MSLGINRPEKIPMDWNTNRCTPATVALNPACSETLGIQFDMV